MSATGTDIAETLRDTPSPTDFEGVLNLIAGERSAEAWDVPAFVLAAARSYTEIAGAGHLMMLEEPAVFCRAVESVLVPA